MMRTIANLLFSRRLARQTSAYINELASAPVRASREEASKVIKKLASRHESKIILGQTQWNQEVAIPTSEIVKGHSLITGGTGSGKTRLILGIVKALFEDSPQRSFGILDAKGELFKGALALLARRLGELKQTDPAAAESLRNRIVIVDFGSGPRDLISPYNLLARGPHVEPGLFAENRTDLLLDLLPGDDALSLAGVALLRRVIMLLSACQLPITVSPDLLYDDSFRARVLNQCADRDLQAYFRHQYPNLPKATVGALARRLDALTSSEALRFSLSAATAPDFRALQDGDRIVLINCFGHNLSRGVRRLLQAIVLSDISQAVFTREQSDRAFTWFCDEAQNLFLNQRLRDHVNDLLTMSRSFGTALSLITQNSSVAVNDARLQHTLLTNIRWSFSMRGDPSDVQFLKPVLPTTGRKPQPRLNPFEEPRFYSLSDERMMELNAIAHLPDRVGYLWLREANEAIRITTQTIELPSQVECEALLSDPTFGKRLPRADCERVKEAGESRKTEPVSEPEFTASLTETYHRLRGGQR